MRTFWASIVGLAALGMASSASAADLAVKAAPMPPPLPVFSWTGFYVGANIGGAWAHDGWHDTLFLTNFNNNAGNGVFIGGGQIGGNYQIGQFVIGGEWDFDWASNHNNSTGVFVPGVGNLVVNSNDRWITTVAARFGWAINNWLLYGKAGGGWVGNNSLNINNLTTGFSVTCGNFNGFGNCSNSTGGWLLGAGFEYAFTNNWTVKAEYDYLGLGNRTVLVPAGAFGVGSLAEMAFATAQPALPRGPQCLAACT